AASLVLTPVGATVPIVSVTVVPVAVIAIVAAVSVTLEGDDATNQQVPEGRLRESNPALKLGRALGGHLEGVEDVRAVHDAIDGVGEAPAAPGVRAEHLAAVGDDLLLERG